MSAQRTFPRILVVNPNRSLGVTNTFVTHARAVAPSGVIIDGVTGTFGAEIVSMEAENIIAAHSALDLLARHAEGYDAAILAISYDSGLDGAREVMPIPVIGMTEAALMAATAIDGPIGIVVFGASSLPLYQRLVRRYGLEHRIAGWEVVMIGSAAGYLTPETQDEAVIQAILRLQSRRGVAAVVICGTAIVGMAQRLQPRVDVRVFDSAAPSVAAALDAIAENPRPVREAWPLSECRGVSAELRRLISARPA